MVGRAEDTPAVILRTRPLGEADLLVVLLTRDLGKVPAAASSARRSKRRFPGGLAGGMLGTAAVSKGRGALWRLERFSASMEHGAVGRDLRRFAYVAYVCELTDQLVLERQPDPELFADVARTVATLVSGAPSAWVLRRYELQLAHRLGLLPALEHCCVCGGPWVEGSTVPFDLGRGGILCAVHSGGAEAIPRAVLAAAHVLMVEGDDPSWLGERPAELVLTAEQRRALRDLSFGMLRRHLHRPLKSIEFFRKLPPEAGEEG